MTPGDVAIHVRDVSHQFGEPGDAQFVQALQHTSLDIARGELLCLIGPSGCGKSTLLNMIGGLLTPTTGTVEVSGKPVRGRCRMTSPSCSRRTRCSPGARSSRTSSSAWCSRACEIRAGAARAEGLEAVGLKDFMGHLSGAAVRRHAAARGARPRAQPGDRHAVDGRAVWRARRADQDDSRRGPLGAVVDHRQDHRVRHPFARRSGVPRRPVAVFSARPAASRRSSRSTSRIRGSPRS